MNTSYGTSASTLKMPSSSVGSKLPTQSASALGMSDLLGQRLEAQRAVMAKNELQRSLSRGMPSSYTPFNDSQFGQRNEEFYKSAPIQPGDTLGAAPFEGESMLLSDYQKQNPDASLQFDPANPEKRWGLPSEQALIKKSSTGGYYIEDPMNPESVAHEPRGEWDKTGDTALLKGLSPRLFQIDHIQPLWAGGLNTPSNKQILPVDLHVKKTKVQAVPLTLWRKLNENPELAKKYGISLTSLADARNMLSSWQDYSDVGIPVPFGEEMGADVGQVPLEAAVNAWKRWQKPKGLGILGSINKFGGDVARASAESATELPVIGPLMMSGLRVLPGAAMGAAGMQAGAALGAVAGPIGAAAGAIIGGTVGMVGGSYLKKSFPDFFARQDLDEAKIRRDARFKVSPDHKPDWLEGLAIKTSPYNETIQDIGDFAGAGVEMLYQFKAGGLALDAASGLLKAGKLGTLPREAFLKGAKGAVWLEKGVSAVTQKVLWKPMYKALGLPAKAWKQFGPGKKAIEAIANTERAATAEATASLELNLGKQIKSPLWDAAEEVSKAPMVEGVYSAAVKFAKAQATLKNIGLMNVNALLSQQDDQSMGAIAERALFATIGGQWLSGDNHTPVGYLKVVGKGFTLGVMEGAWNQNENGDIDIVGGALQNALMLAALHGMGHTEARSMERQQTVTNRFFKAKQEAKPGERLKFTLTEKEQKAEIMKKPYVREWVKNIRASLTPQETMQRRMDVLNDYTGAKLLSSVLPERFTNPGHIDAFKPDAYYGASTPEEIIAIRNEGLKMIDEAWAKSPMKDVDGKPVTINGTPISSGTSEAIARDKVRFSAAVRNLEMRNASPAERAKMEEADFLSIGDVIRNKIKVSENKVPLQERMKTQEIRAYVTSAPPALRGGQTEQSVYVDPSTNPEGPIGVGLAGGKAMGERTLETAQVKRIIASMEPGAKEKQTYKAYLELVPNTPETKKALRAEMSPEQLAAFDESNKGIDPTHFVRVRDILVKEDGSLAFVQGGYITPTEAGLFEGKFAVNHGNKGFVEGGKRATAKNDSGGLAFEVVNLHAQPIVNFAKENSLPGIFADISTNNGIGTGKGNFFIKINATAENLETSKRLLANTGQATEVPESGWNLYVQASVASTPEARKISVEKIRNKFGIEPTHELVDKMFNPEEFGEQTNALKKTAQLFTEAIKTGNPKDLETLVNGKLGDVITPGDETTPGVATDWLSRPGEVTPREMYAVMQKALADGKLNESGTLVYNDAALFLKSIDFLNAKGSRVFLDMPLLGSRPVAAAEAGVRETPTAAVGAPSETVPISAVPTEATQPKTEAEQFMEEAQTPIPTVAKKATVAEGVPEALAAKEATPVPIKAIETPIETAKEPKVVVEAPIVEQKQVLTDAASEFLSQEKPPAVKPEPLAEVAKKVTEQAPLDLTAEPRALPIEEANIKKTLGTKISIDSPEVLNEAMTEGKRIVDGVEVEITEKTPKDAYGRKNGKNWGQTDELFTADQMGLPRNDPRYKALEKAKKQASIAALKKRLLELMKKNGGDSNKAADTLMDSLEPWVQGVRGNSDPLFPTEKSKREFRALMTKIKDEAPFQVLKIEKGQFAGEDVNGVKSNSAGGDLIKGFAEDFPDIGIVEVFSMQIDNPKFIKDYSANNSFSIIDGKINQGREDGERYVILGEAGNKPNNILVAKFNQKLVDSYKPIEGEQINAEDSFKRAFFEDVLKIGKKDSTNIAKLNKRLKILFSREAKLNWLKEDRTPEDIDLFAIEGKTVGDAGLIDKNRLDLSNYTEKEIADVLKDAGASVIGDGDMHATQGTFRQIKDRMNIDPKQGYIKMTYGLPTTSPDGRTEMMAVKGMLFETQSTIERRYEYRLKQKFESPTIFVEQGSVKLGQDLLADLTEGVRGIKTSSAGWRGKVHNEHNDLDAKTSFAILSHLPADANLAPEISRIIEPGFNQYNAVIKELNARKETGTPIKKILEKYPDLGLQLEESDYPVMQKLLDHKAPFRILAHHLDRSIAKTMKTKVLSGKTGVTATYSYLSADMGEKGGIGLMELNQGHGKEFAPFFEVAEMVRGSTGRSGMRSAEVLKSTWETTYGKDSLSLDDARTLARGREDADLNRVVDILLNAKDKLNDRGLELLQKAEKSTYMDSEVMMDRKEFEALGSPEYVLGVRQPNTNLTASVKMKVIISEDYNAKLGKGVVKVGNHDLFINLKADNDGDGLSMFPIGDKKGFFPQKIADYIHNYRLENKDMVLSPMVALPETPMTREGTEFVVNSSSLGGEGIGQAASLNRILSAAEGAGILKVGKPKKLLTVQVSNEATDVSTKRNLLDRLKANNAKNVQDLLLQQITDEVDQKGIGRKERELAPLHDIFNLADTDKKVFSTADIADQFGTVAETNQHIEKRGTVHPLRKAVADTSKGVERLIVPGARESQMSDKAASDAVKQLESKHDKDYFSIKNGTDESKIKDMVLKMTEKRIKLKQKFFEEAEKFVKKVQLAEKNGTLEEDFGYKMNERKTKITSSGRKENVNFLTGVSRIRWKHGQKISGEPFIYDFFSKEYNREVIDAEMQKRTKEIVDAYETMLTSDKGLTEDQIRKISFFLATDPKANRNYYVSGDSVASADFPYGGGQRKDGTRYGEDVYRLHYMIDDPAVYKLFYDAIETFQMPQQSSLPHPPAPVTPKNSSVFELPPIEAYTEGPSVVKPARTSKIEVERPTERVNPNDVFQNLKPRQTSQKTTGPSRLKTLGK